MDSQPWMVEFNGLPGAGKTTVAKAVVEQLGLMGYKCLRKALVPRSGSSFSKYYRFFRFCAAHNRVVLYALSYALRVTPLNRRSLRLGLSFLRKLYFIQRAIREGRRAGYDIILVGQGLLQYLWSIAAPGNPAPRKNPLRLLNSIRKEIPDVVVLFDVDIDTAVERISTRARTGSYYDGMAPEVARSLLARNKDSLEEIVNCAVQLNGTRRLTVKGNGGVRETASSIARSIHEVRCKAAPWSAP